MAVFFHLHVRFNFQENQRKAWPLTCLLSLLLLSKWIQCTKYASNIFLHSPHFQTCFLQILYSLVIWMVWMPFLEWTNIFLLNSEYFIEISLLIWFVNKVSTKVAWKYNTKKKKVNLVRKLLLLLKLRQFVPSLWFTLKPFAKTRHLLGFLCHFFFLFHSTLLHLVHCSCLSTLPLENHFSICGTNASF